MLNQFSDKNYHLNLYVHVGTLNWLFVFEKPGIKGCYLNSK